MIFDEYLLRAMVLAALCSGLPLACSSLLGLLIAFVQSALQVQEQSLQFLAKLGVVILLII